MRFGILPSTQQWFLNRLEIQDAETWPAVETQSHSGGTAGRAILIPSITGKCCLAPTAHPLKSIAGTTDRFPEAMTKEG
jgi:hypothetical protein